MKLPRLKAFGLVVALIPVPVLWCAIYAFGGLERAQDWSLDMRFKARGELSSPAKVVYVDIDSISLDPKEIGGMPWSRHYFAAVSQTLIEEAGVKAVGIDFVLSDAGIPEVADMQKMAKGNWEFARYLWGSPPVVLASSFAGSKYRDENGNIYERSLPVIADGLPPIESIEGPEIPRFMIKGEPFAPSGTGLIDIENGVARRVPLYAPTNVKNYYHLSVEILRKYWGLGPDAIRVSEDYLEMVDSAGEVVTAIPMADKQFLEINWFSKWNSPLHNPRISFKDVYFYTRLLHSDNPEGVETAKAFFAQEDFKDSIVLIGPVDPLLQDLGPTPLDELPVPKVGVHGNVIKTILSGLYLHRLSDLQVFGIIFALTILVATMTVWGGASAVMARILAGLAMVGYVWMAFHFFETFHLVLPLIGPVGSALSTSLLAATWQVVQEQQAKGKIKGMFGTYLAPAVVDSMIDSGKNPELGGHDAEITAYFSDIQSFSSFSEVLTSSQLGDLLNEYLTVCTDIIQEQGGTLDKYIGDAVVAMFGAPIDLENHAYKACLTTLLVQEQLEQLRIKWTQEGDKWPSLVHQMRTRVGLNTGSCMIGNMGSRTRFNYTMMGDNVNLAARMESGAKSWGAFNMVADSTRVACEKLGGEKIVFRPLGRIVVKGRSKPVPIHEVVGFRDKLTDQTFECLDIFGKGMTHYYDRNWSAAAQAFEASAKLEPLLPGDAPGVKNSPSMVYQQIIRDSAKNPPPPDWDGVYIMTDK